jgi:mono/diheme cytochrome c family protein
VPQQRLPKPVIPAELALLLTTGPSIAPGHPPINNQHLPTGPDNLPAGKAAAALRIVAVLAGLGLLQTGAAQDPNHLVQTICIACHNEHTLQAGLDLQNFDANAPQQYPVVAEKMIRKLRAGQMPPREMPRDEDAILQLVTAMENSLDQAARKAGRVGSRPFQRVNRAEYARLVNDLLGLTVDPAEWLPEDQISASFDNIADVQGLSSTLMVAYLTAASDIARRAIGQRDAPATAKTYSNPPSLSQHEWERLEGAPYGTRGGISVLHTFPADADYRLSMGFISGWGERFHDIDIAIDGHRVALVRYGGRIDFQGRKPFPVETDPVFIRAGEHRVTAAFIRQMDGPYEDLIRPNDWSLTGTETSYGTTSPPHLTRLTIEGPYDPIGVSETPARQRIFTCRPTSTAEELPCAETIVSGLATSAYGRDLARKDVDDLLRFYALGAADGGFESGIRTALEAILASPHFLFRLEREPARARPGQHYRLADGELARRLSFFLWGTNPDAELLALADAGRLQRTRTLREQAERMLADPRARSLATRFASLWLRLQDLEKVQPDAFWFPNYSYQLMEAMRTETQTFFHHLVQENRSVLELYSADYSYMNERLATHYGIPGVVGDEFRRVSYPDNRRNGILGHGSVLVQTSLGNRTSPVLRGKWVMQVLLGTPPPPPPPGVPDLEETEGLAGGEVLTTRRRMEMHRANPICAACHKVMDPIGLALDNFDVTGKWRIREFGAPLDTQSTFYDGTVISTPADLTAMLLKRPLPLVREFTANLMAYALGRRVEYFDMPVVRQIVADAGDENYPLQSLILGVITSDQFRMKDVLDAGSNDVDTLTR